MWGRINSCIDSAQGIIQSGHFMTYRKKTLRHCYNTFISLAFQYLIQFSSEELDRIKLWDAWIFYYFFQMYTFQTNGNAKTCLWLFFPLKINHFRVGKTRKITLYSDTYLHLCPVTVTCESEVRILHISDCCHKWQSFG